MTPAALAALCERLEAMRSAASDLVDCDPMVGWSGAEIESVSATAIAAIRELEAKCERARADAIEEAAQLCERRAMQKYDIAAIRALALAPAPTAEGEGKES